MGERLIESWQRRATQARIERCVRSAPRGRGFQPVGPGTGPRPRVPSGVLHCRVPSVGGGGSGPEVRTWWLEEGDVVREGAGGEGKRPRELRRERSWAVRAAPAEEEPGGRGR